MLLNASQWTAECAGGAQQDRSQADAEVCAEEERPGRERATCRGRGSWAGAAGAAHEWLGVCSQRERTGRL